MPRSTQRTYSRYTQDAVSLLSMLIREARIKQKISTQELADRAGISRGLLQRIEKGNCKCEIGSVFEVAVIVGVKLFDDNQQTVKHALVDAVERLTLLPKSVRSKNEEVYDDF